MQAMRAAWDLGVSRSLVPGGSESAALYFPYPHRCWALAETRGHYQGCGSSLALLSPLPSLIKGGFHMSSLTSIEEWLVLDQPYDT